MTKMTTLYYVIAMALFYLGYTWYLIFLKRHAKVAKADWPTRWSASDAARRADVALGPRWSAVGRGGECARALGRLGGPSYVAGGHPGLEPALVAHQVHAEERLEREDLAAQGEHLVLQPALRVAGVEVGPRGLDGLTALGTRHEAGEEHRTPPDTSLERHRNGSR